MRHTPKNLARAAALCLIVLASAGGCAYYNTFYIAKKNYREAQKAQERSQTDGPVPDAVAKYEIVIRQCNKVLMEHPKSKWADDAGYLLGASLYGKGDYRGAIKRLTEFQTRFPKSSFRSEARFTEGLARYRLKEYVEADSIFRELNMDRGFPRKWELCFYAGETQSGLRNYEIANWWYDRAMREASGRRQKGNTLRRSADAHLAAEHPDTAQAVYAQVLHVEERGLQRVEVAMARAEALRQMKKYQEALDFLGDWRAYAAEVGKEGELMLRVYDLMALSGRVPEAIQGYRGLVERFPRTPVAYESQFQIGFLTETALGDLDAAGVEYDKLKTQPSSQFQTQAARRSQNLTTLKQYRTAMASDTTQAAAKAAFLVAELYYFQFEKPDSAVLLYREVEEDFPTSVFAPKSAYARLWIAAYDRQDTLGAMALTDSMSQRYHGTRHAESALYLWKRWSGRTDERTALLDSLLANPDSSRYAVLEPEPELDLPAMPEDSVAAAMRGGAGSHMTPADSARIEALRAARQRELEKRGISSGSRPAATAQAGQVGLADSSTSGSTASPVPSAQQSQPQEGTQQEQAAPPSSDSSEPPPSQQPSGDPIVQPPQQTAPQEEEEEEDLEEEPEDGAGS